MDTVQPEDNLTEVSGTIYGSYDYAFDGKGAWVGHAILNIGGHDPVKASIVDRNTSLNRTTGGGIFGTEIITVTFPNGGSFEVLGKFTRTPMPAPAL